MLRYAIQNFLLRESMRIDILCLFPEVFASPFNQSIVKRASERGLVNIVIHNIRDYTHDKHHTVDDYPYGGGPGMVLKPRVCEHLATDEISVGDYVLSGGELAALVVVDAIVRLIPGVLGSQDSASSDSHSNGLLEYPQYTRPQVYRGWSVPSVLLSGNHGEIAQWRRRQAILRTANRRPDLLKKANLCDEERKWMSENLLSLK
jgi:tRNA (guanine37-N1)-methyltransferase